MATTPFEVTRADGIAVASNGAQTIQMTESDGRMFRRRAIKYVGTDQSLLVEWVVAEVDGVRVYFDGSNVVVSRQDMNP